MSPERFRRGGRGNWRSAGPRRGGIRILGGRWRGRVVTTPIGIRPTQARVREALFSHWGEHVKGARLLELYAGSACVSFEALSRGAASALALDSNKAAVAGAWANRERFGAVEMSAAQARLPAELEATAADMAPFDFVFADPPYKDSDLAELLAAVSALTTVGAEVALEHARRVEPPEGAGQLELRIAKRYGDTGLAFYR